MRIEQAITSRTKVILPVHLYGHPADMDAITALARSRGLYVLEDAAQAHGASWRGRRVGGHGDIVAWSFYPGKNLGAFGDGGAITTNDASLADRVRIMRNYGSRVKYINEAYGWNSRLDPIQAAVLRVKLSHLDKWNARREHVARLYTKGLAGLPMLGIPHEATDAVSAWHLYVIRHRDRDQLQRSLTEAGIGTLIHYPIPPHRQKIYVDAGFGESSFPIAERMAREVLSLPMGPHVTDEQVQEVIARVTAVV